MVQALLSLKSYDVEHAIVNAITIHTTMYCIYVLYLWEKKSEEGEGETTRICFKIALLSSYGFDTTYPYDSAKMQCKDEMLRSQEEE